MRLSPIPRAARAHTVSIAPCARLDVDHAPSWAAAVVFPFVKVEYSARTQLGKEHARREVSGVCYIDATDAPADPAALHQASDAAGYPARLLWGQQAFLIEAVTPHFHPDGTVHHWKVIFR